MSLFCFSQISVAYLSVTDEMETHTSHRVEDCCIQGAAGEHLT